jgi:hypothetical protein
MGIQKYGNTHYPYCIQPWKSYKYYLLVLLLVIKQGDQYLSNKRKQHLSVVGRQEKQ